MDVTKPYEFYRVWGHGCHFGLGAGFVPVFCQIWPQTYRGAVSVCVGFAGGSATVRATLAAVSIIA